jgi:sulfotransferase family protein
VALADLEAAFLLGSPRSGTSWLQQMLASHPLIASPPETYVFARINELEQRWTGHLERPEPIGLPAAVARHEFEDALSLFAERIYAAVLAHKPGARVLLDKTPRHAQHLDLIVRYVPRARFVHIVRDGRDVTASVLRTHRGWGWFWAPRSADTAARRWDRYVRMVRAASERLPVLEVRYEHLAGPEGVQCLLEALAFCGIHASTSEAEEIYNRFDLSRDGRRAMRECDGLVGVGEMVRDERFVGPGRPGTWRTELGRLQRATVERRAGELLAELGYAEPGWSGTGRLSRVAAPMWNAIWPRVRYRSRHLRRALLRGQP